MRLFLFLMTVLFTAAPQALACSVCFGDPNSAQSKALAVAVLFLLGTICSVLGAIGYSIFVCARRAKKLSQAIPSAAH